MSGATWLRARAASTPLPLPILNASRARIASALRSCTARERLALALLLYERLTPAEAGAALGLSPRAVERAYRAALRELRVALRGRRPARLSRALARRAADGPARRAA